MSATRSTTSFSEERDVVPAVEAIDLWRHLGDGGTGTQVLNGLSLTVQAGEWVSIMGPSGCGKTTLIHALGGLEGIDAGSISIGGCDLGDASERERARLRRTEIAYVFQQYNLLSDLTALENVMLPLRLAGRSRRGARREAHVMLQRLGLEKRADAVPARLSGGEQQRVAIARALAIEPVVLLADEPTGALDAAASGHVLDLLRDQHRAGQTIVMVTHDHRVAAAADRIVMMRDGRLVEEHHLRAVHPMDLPGLVRLEAET